MTALSEDHKPDLPDERERIEGAGMLVLPDVFRDPDALPGAEGSEENLVTIWKVVKSESDRLGVSRAFGDFDYKGNESLGPERQAVVCTPDIRVHARDRTRDMFLVLACDGVWDVMSNDQVGAFVTRAHGDISAAGDRAPEETLAEVGDRLLDECLRRGSRDNMSALIVSLGPSSSADGYRRAAVIRDATATKLFTDEAP